MIDSIFVKILSGVFLIKISFTETRSILDNFIFHNLRGRRAFFEMNNMILS